MCRNQSIPMLNKISWSEFIWFLVLIIFCYYGYTAFCFRQTLLSFFRSRIRTANPVFHSEPVNDHEDADSIAAQTEISFSSIHELLEELKDLFVSAAKTRMVKEELVQAISTRLKTYPKLKETSLQQDINQHIRTESKNICGIQLGPDDIKRLWPS